MKFTFDVKFVGYEQVSVEAPSRKSAEQRALEHFEKIYEKAPAWDLRSKSQELHLLGSEELKTFYVVMLRSLALLGTQGFDSVQHLQYIAGPIEAADEDAAARIAQAELKKADRSARIAKGDATVLGVIEGGVYRPWFNGSFR